MNNVFPESMNPLPADPQEAINIMEDYIRYMTERIDFAFSRGTILRNHTVTFDSNGYAEIKLGGVTGEWIPIGCNDYTSGYSITGTNAKASIRASDHADTTITIGILWGKVT